MSTIERGEQELPKKDSLFPISERYTEILLSTIKMNAVTVDSIFNNAEGLITNDNEQLYKCFDYWPNKERLGSYDRSSLKEGCVWAYYLLTENARIKKIVLPRVSERQFDTQTGDEIAQFTPIDGQSYFSKLIDWTTSQPNHKAMITWLKAIAGYRKGYTEFMAAGCKVSHIIESIYSWQNIAGYFNIDALDEL
jgi:hypothetical protein